MGSRTAAKQPSMLSLVITALLCAVSIAWAYQDRQQRLGHAGQSSQTPAMGEESPDEFVEWRPAPAPRAEPWSPAPMPESSGWGSLSSPHRAPGFESVSRLPLANQETLEPPTAQIVTIAPIRSQPTVLPEIAAPRPVAGSPSRALTPDELAVEERSVLVEELTPTPAAPIAETQASDQSLAADQDITPLPIDPAVQAASSTDPGELLTYTPAATEISLRVADDVRAAFGLGRHGALFAARQGFIDVMRAIATAKDGQQTTTSHTDALEAGLIAIDEARDFLPGGVVSKELSVAEAAASHRTPMLDGRSPEDHVLPHQAAALYYRYAEQKLAHAVEGEQAGSMALYGLGKTYAQLSKIEGDAADNQKSLAMYRAALLAHQANHLAANELGVGLAQAGRYKLAAEALDRSITHGGGSTVYHNLAHVQHKLGDDRLAAETSRRAERLAMQERAAGVFSRERGVEWVPPQRMAGRAPAPPTSRTATAPAPYRGPVVPYQANRAATPVRSQTTVR